jgi:hypothetical protein
MSNEEEETCRAPRWGGEVRGLSLGALHPEASLLNALPLNPLLLIPLLFRNDPLKGALRSYRKRVSLQNYFAMKFTTQHGIDQQ